MEETLKSFKMKMKKTLKNSASESYVDPTKTSFDSLPHDIISDILLRLPFGFLITLKSVSKSWYNTIRNLDKEDEEPGLLIVPESGDTDEVVRYVKRGEEMKSVYHRTHVLKNSCNGLLCFWKYKLGSYDSEGVVICNPSLNESITLPEIGADTKLYTVRLGYSPSTKEYKVVLLPLCLSALPRIHTLGTSSWRYISCSIPFLFDDQDNFVYANGGLHVNCKILPSSPFNDNELKSYHIVSFDIGSEEFYITNYPESMKSVLEHHDTGLIILRSCLAIVNTYYNIYDVSSIEIWVLKDNIEKQWVKEYVLNFEIPGREMMSEFVVVGFWKQGEILFMSRYPSSHRGKLIQYCFVSYDPKTEQIEDVSDVNVTTPVHTITNLLPYRSLVSLEPNGYRISRFFVHYQNRIYDTTMTVMVFFLFYIILFHLLRLLLCM